MSTATQQPAPPAAPAGAADPSMEDILASIRRILSEDEAEAPAATDAPPQAGPAPGSDVLELDPAMLVEEYPPEPSPPAPPPVAVQPAEHALPGMHSPRPEPPPPMPEERPATDSLLGPEASAAAASSVGSLLRTLVTERQHVPVYRGGPTIEDLVREEIRPLLKLWLDTNLPPLVERLVRAEIERVVGRGLS
jgi:uncharacterized protein